ncbi:MAG: gliding motility protein GldN, partial [Bacteroidota bacterium]
GFFSAAFAQQDTIVNPNSIERIPYYEQLYRFRVWRVVDLNEKQNAGFKSVRSDIAEFLITNIQNGALPIFDETVENPNDPAVALVMNTAIVEPPYDSKKSYLASETASYNGKNYISSRNGNVGNLPTDTQWWDLSTDQTTFFSKADVKAITIIEDVIFDKRRSRLYYDIQAIGLLAQKAGSTSIDPIAFIQYKDFYNLVEKAAHSKDVKERDRVMWRNRYNPSENRSYVDAFKLRLFHGVVEKVENPDDRSITQIYELNGRTYGESIFARWEEEMKMMEKEHNLWEY